MFDLNSLNLVNVVAHELVLQGRNQSEAIKIVSDKNRQEELQTIIKSYEQRNKCNDCAA